MRFGQLCILCPNPAQYHCCDCSFAAFYCEDRYRITHYNHFLYMPEIRKLGRFVLAPLSVSLPLLHDGCQTAHFQQITIVSLRGMYVCRLNILMYFFCTGQHHDITLGLCACMSVSEQLWDSFGSFAKVFHQQNILVIRYTVRSLTNTIICRLADY